MAAPVTKKRVAKRPRGNQGGGREEINHPGIATGVSQRLRNRKRARFDGAARREFHPREGKEIGPVGRIVAWHGIEFVTG
jgi:hypothetical protein